MHLERLAVVASSVTHLARHIDVGQEVHLDLDRPVARAVVTATALDVERETTGHVSTDLGLSRLGEQLAHVVENAGVCRGVAARGPPDRPLVDVHDLVEVLKTQDCLVPTGDLTRAVELVGENHVEDVIDQRRLARARNPSDRNEIAQREAHVQVIQIVLARPDHGDLAPILRTSDVRSRDFAATRKIGAGDGVGVLEQVCHRARVDDIAAVLPRARADVYDPVGGGDGVLVVLHDDEGVAQVPQSGQRLDQTVVVALVQADRRLVQDVQDADQPGADLGRQPNALSLTAGQGAGRTVQREVVQAYVEQKAQASLDLLDDPLGDLTLARREVDLSQELGAVGDRERTDLGDALTADMDRQRLGLQPGATALGTGHLSHVALVALTRPLGVSLCVPALDERHHTLESRCVGTVPAIAVAVLDVDLVVLTVQDRVTRTVGQCVPRLVQGELQILTQGRQDPQEVVSRTRPLRPWRDRTLVDREVLVGDQQLWVDLELGTQPGALGAGAERGVERERARFELVHGQGVVVGAGHLLRVPTFTPGVLGIQVDEVDDQDARGQAERGLHRVGQPTFGARVIALGDKSVDHDLDGVLLLLLQGGRLDQGDDLTVDAGARETLGLELAEHLDELALAGLHHRRQHLEAGVFGQLQQTVDDLLRALSGDGLATHRAVRSAGAGKQQPEVVVDLRDRADGGPGVAVGRLLVDRHSWRQAFDEVDVGFVHLPEKLACIGTERLDIAALPLGEDRVEGQRRLARPGEPGEDDQAVARKVDGDIAQVVLTCSAHDEAVMVVSGWADGHFGHVRNRMCLHRQGSRHRT